MAIRSWATVFSLMALLTLPSFPLPKAGPQQIPASEESPVMRVEVNHFSDSRHEVGSCVQGVQIAFVDDGSLALTFIKADDSPKAQKDKSVPHSGPFVFRTILFDVRTGHPQATHDWSSATAGLEFLPTHDGRFLLATSQEVKLYSSSFQLLGHRDLPPKGPGSTFSHAVVSQSGHRIVVKSYHERQTRLELLDADSLQVLHSWSTPEVVISFTATDNMVAIETRDEIQVSGDDSWRRVHAFPDLRSCTSRFVLDFISDDKLAFRDCDDKIAVMDTSGNLLFKNETFASHTDLFDIATSASGQLFGALVYRTYCAASWFVCLLDPIAGSTPERAIIYDASRGEPTYERRIAGDTKHPLGEIALSPRGLLLAVLYRVRSGRSEGVVEVFHLAPLTRPQEP